MAGDTDKYRGFNFLYCNVMKRSEIKISLMVPDRNYEVYLYILCWNSVATWGADSAVKTGRTLWHWILCCVFDCSSACAYLF